VRRVSLSDGASVAIALIALVFTCWQAYRQNRLDKRKAVLTMHDRWHSAEMRKHKFVYKTEVAAWRKLGDRSPAIKQYSSRSMNEWGEESDQKNAHAEIHRFFADVETMIKAGTNCS
jgi:hypothetical protein